MHNSAKLTAKPIPPPKPDYNLLYTSPMYNREILGECTEGSYIEVYIPARPYHSQQGHLQVVVYLHAFALGASQIYRSHLEHLVKQGFYVFFPSYQHDFCQVPKTLWQTLYTMTKAVLNPYPISPQGWLHSAIRSVNNAFERLQLTKADIDTYLFGHSLGGLFALSWSYYAQSKVPVSLLPKQVIAVDPIPCSDSNIPAPIRAIARSVGGFKDRVTIKTTGAALNIPIAILHGYDDPVVSVFDWKPWFKTYIASTAKRFYVSYTDSHGCPAMYADHMQAAVDTSFFPDGLAKPLLGGVGSEDTLRWRFVWAALDQVIREGVQANE